MPQWKWYLNRLTAMSPREVAWRLSEKIEQRRERKFLRTPCSVASTIFNHRLTSLTLNPDCLGLAFHTNGHTFNDSIHLLGGYAYETYKTQWHAGFQTENQWPRVFSYDLHYKQNDAIGDARTNWELNRHFQLTLLAKDYFHSGEKRFLTELKTLFDDWCRENPFLIGISWTSVMEVAIRSISWMVALAYLKKAQCDDTPLLTALNRGIVNMLDYVACHRSRYSSANNHLVVEAAAMAIGGYALSYHPWREEAIAILTDELPRQNYPDGVNREMSLHYQAFVLEAYALTAHCMSVNGDEVPALWLNYIDKLSAFVCHSSYDELSVISFGDDDEGKVLDLQGGDIAYISYVLQLCSLVTSHRYASFQEMSETVRCLFDEEQIARIAAATPFDTANGHCFAEGGYTFMRSADGQVLVAVDHADLGFGSIAAHGHADALSFQMLIHGIPFFTDPGTYIYHCDIGMRDKMRQTLQHNTLCIDGRDQSEMLGAFLWGKKASCQLLKYDATDDEVTLTAIHDGYAPVCHQRTFSFQRQSARLTIFDELNESSEFTVSFVLGAACHARQHDGQIVVSHGSLGCIVHIPQQCISATIEQTDLSERYGVRQMTEVIRFTGKGRQMKTIIELTY